MPKVEIKHLAIETEDDEAFLKELEALCIKHSIGGKAYTFKFLASE